MENVIATTGVETHPQYTFIRYGRARDFDPSFSGEAEPANSQEHWWIEIADELYVWPVAYSSREALLGDIDEALFSDRHAELVARQIAKAVRTGEIKLALLLTDRRAEYRGRVRARSELRGKGLCACRADGLASLQRD